MSDWTDPEWIAQAHGWIHSHVHVVGDIEQPHAYPWATVLRVPTEGGNVYFKATTQALGHEAVVVDLLSKKRPDCVPVPIAVDPERGWMLIADAGTQLRALIQHERDMKRWLDVLPLYASVQIDLMDDAEQLIALGVPDLRLARLATMYELFLDRLDGLPEAESTRLRRAVPRVREMCGELATYDIPETVQHDDFHDGQVYVRDGRYLLLDWGDVCVSHPFFTLAVTLEGTIAWGPDDIEGSVDTQPFRDAYLEAFTDFGSATDLLSATQIALRLGWICRAINGHVPGDLDPTRNRLRMFFDGSA